MILLSNAQKKILFKCLTYLEEVNRARKRFLTFPEDNCT